MTEPHLFGWSFREITPHRGQPGYDGMGYVSDQQGRDILHVGESSLTPEQNVAVGLMSAAAPDLREALRDFMDKAQLLNCAQDKRFSAEWEAASDDFVSSQRRAEAALAKADGK